MNQIRCSIINQKWQETIGLQYFKKQKSSYHAHFLFIIPN